MIALTWHGPRFCLATVLLSGCLAACSSWHIENTSPEQLVGEDSTRRVRITRQDGERLTIDQPRLRGDTLYGTPSRVRSSPANQPVAIPLADVREIAVPQRDAGKTIGLILGITAFVGGAAFAIGLAIASANSN